MLLNRPIRVGCTSVLMCIRHCMAHKFKYPRIVLCGLYCWLLIRFHYQFIRHHFFFVPFYVTCLGFSHHSLFVVQNLWNTDYFERMLKDCGEQKNYEEQRLYLKFYVQLSKEVKVHLDVVRSCLQMIISNWKYCCWLVNVCHNMLYRLISLVQEGESWKDVCKRLAVGVEGDLSKLNKEKAIVVRFLLLNPDNHFNCSRQWVLTSVIAGLFCESNWRSQSEGKVWTVLSYFRWGHHEQGTFFKILLMFESLFLWLYS